MATRKHKLWEGRFAAATAPIVEQFTASIAVDKRLAPYDIAGSLAHCHMLVTRGIIPAADGKRICRGLAEIEQEITQGTFRFDAADEDIHMAIERSLIEKIGPVGGRLHTARSRNDQVALDLRLFVRAEIGAILKSITAFQKALAATARKHAKVVMPGYTHLQRAQEGTLVVVRAALDEPVAFIAIAAGEVVVQVSNEDPEKPAFTRRSTRCRPAVALWAE